MVGSAILGGEIPTGPAGIPLVIGGGSGTAGMTMGSIRGIGITLYNLKYLSA